MLGLMKNKRKGRRRGGTGTAGIKVAQLSKTATISKSDVQV
jgi:hypothetical protein